MESYFSVNYQEARAKFLALATQRGARQHAYLHPMKGRDAEELALDVAALGKRTDRLLLITSGCHGVEGYCGSGIQVAALSNGPLLEQANSLGIEIVFAHALNPYGFSFGRRVNEDNVDLNRNFHDFAQAIRPNTAYGAFHDRLIPANWPPSPENEQSLMAEFAVHGMAYMQGAITGGQHSHPHGLHYSGQSPVWSHTTMRRLLREHCQHARHVAWIDLHSGLGPVGVGERMFSSCLAPGQDHLEGPIWERACAWWAGHGATALTRVGKDSASTDKITGNIGALVAWDLSHASVTKLTLEFGTQPPLAVLQAMRAEQWLQLHPQAACELANNIKQQMRNAFYVDTPQWREAVTRQGLEAFNQAIVGLSGQT
jgi:Protein of unknown function (DUF2817)